MPLTQMGALMGEHKTQLVVGEQVKRPRADHDRAPAPATGQAVRGRSIIHEQDQRLALIAAQATTCQCQALQLAATYPPRLPGARDSHDDDTADRRQCEQHSRHSQ